MLIGHGVFYGLGTHTGLHHRDSGPGTPLRNEYLVAENRILKV